MSKIGTKFAPLFDELGHDERFIMQLSDFDKLLFLLVLFTAYMTNNRAPLDATYYQHHYNLRARPYQIRRSLAAIQKHFRKLVASNKTLSLLNFKGYKNTVTTNARLDKELDKDKEGEGESKRKRTALVIDSDWLITLQASPAYATLNVQVEFHKASEWCTVHDKVLTKRRFINWLNRAEPTCHGAPLPKPIIRPSYDQPAPRSVGDRFSAMPPREFTALVHTLAEKTSAS